MPNTKRTKKVEKKAFNPLIGSLTLEEVMNNLDFMEEEVEHAARTLPKLWLEAAQHRVRIMRVKQNKSAILDAARVDVAATIRATALADGVKLTIQGVTELVEGDEEVRDALKSYNNSQLMEEFAKLILEAIRTKKHAIQIVADSQKGEAGIGNMAEKMEKMGTHNSMRSRLAAKYSQISTED